MPELQPAAATEAVVPETVMPGETIATDMPNRQNDDTGQGADTPETEAQAEEVAAETPAAETTTETKQTPEQQAEKKKLDWREQRRIEETNKRRIAEERARVAEAELAELKKAKPAGEQTQPQPVVTLSPEQAREQAKRELQAEERARVFNEATGRILKAGQTAIPGFDEARQEMVANFGEQLNSRPDFFEALIDLAPDEMAADKVEEHRARVFHALAADPEQAERVLSMPPMRMAIELTKLSERLAKPTSQPISKAPAPVRPIGGAPQNSGRIDDPKLSDEDFSKQYRSMLKAKGYGQGRG